MTKTTTEHFSEMLGLASGELVTSKLCSDEFEVDRRISEAVSTIHDHIDEVRYVARAMNELGIPAAKALVSAVSAISSACEDIRSCQNDSAYLRLQASQQGTANMMNAVMAAISVSEDKP